MKKGKGAIIVLIILACLGLSGWYASTILGDTSASQKETDNSKESEGIKLGLDLSGGVSITYDIVEDSPSATDIADTIAKLRKEQQATQQSIQYIRLETTESQLKSLVYMMPMRCLMI